MAGQRSGFDFTLHMRRVTGDVVARLAELSHIDLSRVAFSFAQARKNVRHGVWATLTPMRFAGGSLTCRRGGRAWTVERLFDEGGREMLYILNFYLPRFMDLPLDEKLTTLVHELWHISPEFDGDLRRHPGRCYAHGGSQRRYDAAMAGLVRRWRAQSPPDELYQFLEGDFAALCREHGPVYGIRVPAPKMIRVSAA
ncbi:MAG: hypothetical protein WD176_09420 [Pirellulales bacterium]